MTGAWNLDGRTDFLFRSTTDQVRRLWSPSTGLPSHRPLLVFEAGAGIRYIAGLGALTGDSASGGLPVTAAQAAVACTDAAGSLWLLTDGSDVEFFGLIVSGCLGYRISDRSPGRRHRGS